MKRLAFVNLAVMRVLKNPVSRLVKKVPDARRSSATIVTAYLW